MSAPNTDAASVRPRVLLADDHAMLLDAFEKLLEPRCEVVGKVTDGRALLEAAPRLRPDVIVVDIAMPLLNGLEAARRIKQSLPDVKLIFLTMNEDADVAAEAVAAGASAYLLKKSAASELFQAIQEILQGKTYFTPQIARQMQDSFIRDPWGRKRKRELTPRQREVLQLLAEGRSMKEIAGILRLATRTVAFHKYRIMEVLGVKTTADLVQFAVKHHLV